MQLRHCVLAGAEHVRHSASQQVFYELSSRPDKHVEHCVLTVPEQVRH